MEATGLAPANVKAKALSASSSSVAPARGEASSASQATDLTIAINHGKFMTLHANHVVLEVEPEARRGANALCGISFSSTGSTSPLTILLHNVLWAERKDTCLEITYAESTGNHRLRPTRVSVNISSNADATVTSWIEALLNRAYGRAKRQRRAKVLVNPHAGPGGAMGKWQNGAEPLFRAARMILDVETTTRSGQAIEITRNINIDDFDTIVACSGDGLPYEIFNGLGERPDARRALAMIAISQIPCGSANAMACTLYGSPYVSEAALGIIKGIDTHIDLVSLTQGTDRKLCFLSLSVGMLAEADLATEHLRWMGAARFNIGVLMRLYKKKPYPCDLDIKVELEDKTAIKAAYKHHIHRNRPDPVTDSQNRVSSDLGIGLPPLKYGTVNDPLPQDGWQRIKFDNMGTFYCGRMPCMAPDTVLFPAAHADDGLMDLVTIDSDVPLMTALNLMDSIGDEGNFFDHPLVKYRKISAFRITPRDQEDGYISIDGEKAPFAPFQAEIHPKLGKVYALEGKYVCKGPKGWEKV
ncbi:diacylglycerol kinase catalytic domain-containing protein [Ilyonectria destructans]|nr:diacylglycerol kinase catalytic domain-containing protein [Ilyonectria destructans]